MTYTGRPLSMFLLSLGVLATVVNGSVYLHREIVPIEYIAAVPGAQTEPIPLPLVAQPRFGSRSSPSWTLDLPATPSARTKNMTILFIAAHGEVWQDRIGSSPFLSILCLLYLFFIHIHPLSCLRMFIRRSRLNGFPSRKVTAQSSRNSTLRSLTHMDTSR